MIGDECNCPVCSYDRPAPPKGLTPAHEWPVFIRAFGEPARPITNPDLAARVRADALARTPLQAAIDYGSSGDTTGATWSDPDGWHLSALFGEPVELTGWAKGDELEAQAAFDEVAFDPFAERSPFDAADWSAGIVGRAMFGNDYQPAISNAQLRAALDKMVDSAVLHGIGAAEMFQHDIPRSIDAILDDLEDNRQERAALLDELVAAIDDGAE